MSHPKLPPAQTAHRGHDHRHPLGSSSQSVTVFLDSWPPLTMHIQSRGALSDPDADPQTSYGLPGTIAMAFLLVSPCLPDLLDQSLHIPRVITCK